MTTRFQHSPSFYVVPGRFIYETIFGSIEDVVRIVEMTYRSHIGGKTVCPASSFLRFPGRRSDLGRSRSRVLPRFGAPVASKLLSIDFSPLRSLTSERDEAWT
jgi:hypothetical protein